MSTDNKGTPRSAKEIVKHRLQNLGHAGAGGYLLVKVTLKDNQGQDVYSRGIIYNYEDDDCEFIKHVYTKFKCAKSKYVIKSLSKQQLVIEDEEDFLAAVMEAFDRYHTSYDREVEFLLVPREE